MQIGQPIRFDHDGKEVFGIVTQVLPDRKGVMAKIDPTKPQIVHTAEPHKIRDPKNIASIIKLFNQQAAKEKEVAVASAFDKAMAELNNPSVEDAIRLNGMNISVANLPKAATDATAIDKLFF